MSRSRPSTSRADSSSSVANEPQPIDTFQYKNGRLLDTIFVSKKKKKPRWATITTGAVTTLYTVSSAGHLAQSACINWPNGDSKEAIKTSITVEINGVTYPSENFGRKRGGSHMNATEAHRFEIEGRKCQWNAKMVEPFGHMFSSMNGNDVSYLQWECTTDAVNASPTIRPSSSSSRLKSLLKRPSREETRTKLAILRLPGGFHARREYGLAIYQDGKPYAFQLLLSSILLGSGKDDWKKSQSKATPQELEAMISSDAAGALPAYTPEREDRDTHDTRRELHPTVPAVSPWRWGSRDRQELAQDPIPSPRYEYST